MLTRLLIAFTIPSIALASNCDELFKKRSTLKNSEEAYKCFELESKSPDRVTKAWALSQMSYLKFFMAEFFMDYKMTALSEGIALAEKGILLYGDKYDVASYSKLEKKDKEVLATLLYNYGLTTSRYVDLAGKFEAIKRMEDIKKSMNSIIRIKEESTAFYGAHRTLGIFHMKVPAIAGGRIEISKQYLDKAVTETQDETGLSLYPANNIALGDLYYKLGKNDEACAQLELVTNLDEGKVRALENGHFTETMSDVQSAKESYRSRRCR